MGLLFRRRRMKWINALGHDRKALELYRPIGLACILIGGAILILALRWNSIFTKHNDIVLKEQQKTFYSASRRLLQVTGAAPTSSHDTHTLPIWERCDEEVTTGVGPVFVVVYIILILIIFVALAIVCDDFFVPSLEAISEKLKLSEDVAGATFMAGGSSAPELFTSIAGVAFETDVGVGTIVGSAVFNILIIIALTAALAGQVLHLDWRPLIRDSFYYFMSICLFIYFSWDGLFHIWEAVCLLVLYIIYIVLMAFNPKIMDWMGTWKCICCKKGEVLPVDAEAGDGKSPDSTDGATEQTHVEHMANGGSHVHKDDKAARPMVSFTGGHARRLSIISQHSSSDMPDVHYFRHQRGSIMGALTNHRHSQDSALGHHHTSSVLPPIKHLEREHYAMSGERKNSEQEMEMCNYRASSQESIGNKSSLLNSYNSPKSPTLSISDCPTSDPTLTSDLQNFPHQHPLAIEDKIEEERSSVESEEDKEDSASHKEKDDKDNTSGDGSTQEEEEEEESLNICPCLPCCPKIRTYPPQRGGTGCWENAKLFLRWLIFVVSFPFVILFSWTIPDCSKDHNRKWFIVSFIMSVIWIMALSFGMVMLVGRTGCIIGIDTFVMGLVIIAIGTSVPDALSSILVAREGYGDMAVSNAIGSNVFDINLGLGLPFVITIAAKNGQPISLLKGAELTAWANGAMVITPHAKFGFILLFILICCLTIFSIAKFRLNKLIGISFVTLYILFLCYAFVQELVCNYDC